MYFYLSYTVLDYASGGQLIEWDDDESKWFFSHEDQHEPLKEDYLRKVFRDCIKGLNYRMIEWVVGGGGG